MKQLGLFIALVGLALGLRLYQLGTLPTILNRDEAALAYNAVLLKETGRDEWGRKWPLSLESFGDYKLPGYSYTLVGLFSLFGVSETVVRLPAALAGTWLVVIAFLIAKKLEWSKTDQLLIALTVATTPVFIFYSRMAWEAMLSVGLMVSSLYILVFPPTKPKQRWMSDLIAALILLLAVFTYNIPFILLPFFVPFLCLVRGWRKPAAWLWPVTLLVLIFLFSAFIFIPLTSQKSGIIIFSDPTIYTHWIEYRTQLSPLERELLGSKYMYFGWLIGQRIVASFSPAFLVIRGGTHPWHQIPGFAHLTWPIYFLGLVGVIRASWLVTEQFFQKRFTLRTSGEPLAWLYLLFASLVPSVITVDAPHATRSLVFLFLWLWMAVKGWQWLSQTLNSRIRHSSIPTLVVTLVILVSSLRYVYGYFGAYPDQQTALKPGYQEVLTEIQTQYPNQSVAVVDPDGYHYILTAWYLRLSPATYFSTIIRQQPDRIGFRYGEKVDRYHFIGRREDRSAAETVLIEWKDDSWQVTQGN